MHIQPYADNAKKHPPKQIEQIAESIKRFGMNQQIVVDEKGIIIVGHGRYLAMQKLGMELEDKHILQVKDLTQQEINAYRLADNKLNESDWDMSLVLEELHDLADAELQRLTGFDMDILKDDMEDYTQGKLVDRFLMPPFSVLNARTGEWQDRKKMWLHMGIKSEEGRGEEVTDSNDTGGLLMKSWTAHPEFYNGKTAKEKELGKTLTTKEYLENYYVPPTDGAYASGTSIFDPVLTELMYLWFAPSEANVIDPFAGGSVRGIVASKLGHKYHGTELSTEQVKANRVQAKDILTNGEPIPEWADDDANEHW